MHDTMMAQANMNDEEHNVHENGFGNNGGWSDMQHSYSAPQHSPPIYEHGGFGYIHQIQHGLPMEPSPSFNSPRMPPQLTIHPIWPSSITNPTSYSAPPVPIPPPGIPVVKGIATKAPTQSSPTPRKTLTDTDRRKMCQVHEDNPTMKQTEIGVMFGVERSTVSKVLRNKDKYLFPDDQSQSPLKRAKGIKSQPDFERALSIWYQKNEKNGITPTDDAIRERFTMFLEHHPGSNELTAKANSPIWLEKFKQKQKTALSGAKLARRASETNISDRSLVTESRIEAKVESISPSVLQSPSPLSGSKSEDDSKAGHLNGYFDFGSSSHSGVYKHSNTQSTTSLASNFTDNAPSFSGGPSTPTTPFTFSPENPSGAWLPPNPTRLPPPSNFQQRPRSQTFPQLGIDPSFISTHANDPPTPKYGLPATAPSSALDSPINEMPPHFGLDSAISSPLHHSSSNGSMGPPHAPMTGLQSPPSSSAPSSPTQDDARRALDILISYFQQAPSGLVDQNEWNTVLKLTDKLRIHTPAPLPGGLHRIAEQEGEHVAPKMEQSISTGC